MSHVRQGHPTTLYCTDTVSNVPEGVIVKPASEIMEIDREIVTQTSESFLSNVFRYKMIQATDAVWIDCDAFCHRPFPDEMQNIYAGHGFRGALNCGVIYIPKDGELIHRLLDYYFNLPAAPPWFSKQQRKKIDKHDPALPHAMRIYNAEHTAFGPQAFTYFAQQTGDYDKALTPDYLYPVPFQLNDVFYDSYGRVEGPSPTTRFRSIFTPTAQSRGGGKILRFRCLTRHGCAKRSASVPKRLSKNDT